MDPNVAEITAVGYTEPVYVVHRNFADLNWLRTNIFFNSELELQNFNLRLAQKLGKSLTAAVPMVDVTTPEGHRVSLTFGDEITHPGSTFSLRKFPEEPYSLAYLIARRMLTPLMAAYLWQVFEVRGFVQVLGTIGGGKTTLLQALLASVNPNAKIITVEDVMEINLPHENWQRFHTRPVHFATSERFEVDLFDLIKLVMRHRPDYVAVGEVRGEEIKTLTHASSLGHSCACLPGDEPILYVQGERYELSPIGDFVENVLKGKIQNPKVLSFDSCGKVVESALKRVYKVPSTGVIEEIKIEGGKVFRVSPNHPVLVLNHGEITQKRADEVTKGDLIPILKTLPKKGTLSKISFGKVTERKEVLTDDTWLYDVETEHGNFLHSGTVFTHNSTFHSFSPEAAIARMRAPPMDLKDADILQIWCMPVAARLLRPNGEVVYRVNGIYEINPTKDGRPEITTIFRYNVYDDSFSPNKLSEVIKRSRRLREAAEAQGLSERDLAKALQRKVKFLEDLVRRKEFGYRQYVVKVREFYSGG
jgi:type IV secretory pathway ATPase VirB11/archaellum biosynthesis ATPase